MTVPTDSAGPFKTGSSLTEKGKKELLVIYWTLSGSGKPVPNVSKRNAKYTARDSSQVSGSSRKRARMAVDNSVLISLLKKFRSPSKIIKISEIQAKIF